MLMIAPTLSGARPCICRNNFPWLHVFPFGAQSGLPPGMPYMPYVPGCMSYTTVDDAERWGPTHSPRCTLRVVYGPELSNVLLAFVGVLWIDRKALPAKGPPAGPSRAAVPMDDFDDENMCVTRVRRLQARFLGGPCSA
jgi:hypothetical protein